MRTKNGNNYYKEEDEPMSKNDIEVIQYKMLMYLYESLKAGHTTSLDSPLQAKAEVF